MCKSCGCGCGCGLQIRQPLPIPTAEAAHPAELNATLAHHSRTTTRPYSINRALYAVFGPIQPGSAFQPFASGPSAVFPKCPSRSSRILSALRDR